MRQTFLDLYKAYTQCRIGKQFSSHQTEFELKLSDNLVKLSNELVEKTYKVSPHHYFIVEKPKPREIFSAHFRDRVIHHYLVAKLTPTWEKKFSHSSFACRKGKGVHKAIKYLQTCAHKISQGGTQHVYVLQLDIESFFASIHRPTIISLVKKPFRDPYLRWLIDVCFGYDPRKRARVSREIRCGKAPIIPYEKSWFSKPPDFGIPIGNLYSQVGANVYLNELDHFILRKLKPQSYIRYTDDLTLMDTDREKLLSMIAPIRTWLAEHRKMKLNESKTKLGLLKDGIKFLGYEIFQTLPSHNEGYTTKFFVPRAKLWKFLKSLRHTEKLNFSCNTFNHPLDMLPTTRTMLKPILSINSQLGHLKHARTFEFRKKALNKMKKKNFTVRKKLKISKNFLSVKFKRKKFKNR